MSKRFILLWTSCMLANYFFAQDLGSEQRIEWRVIHPISGDTIEFGEKGSVQEALIGANFLPDPTVGSNETLFAWIEEHQWTIIGDFTIKKLPYADEFVDIVLPSVDTYADIYLNDERILRCKNAFLPYRLTINKKIKLGINSLKIVFTPPVLFHQESYKKAKYKLPTTNDTHKIAIAPYTRKPQYQFGWDWTFRMNTIGLNEPVKIECYYQNKINATTVQTQQIGDQSAQLALAVQLTQKHSTALSWESKLFGKIDYTSDFSWLYAQVSIENPILWWPRDHGEQFLYHDTWIIRNKNGTIIDQKEITFGIRIAELVQKEDEWGTSYQIMLNKRSIFCKGGNYIPQNVFLASISNEQIAALIEQVEQANFNMIRVWGGGAYPNDFFFEQCDKKGIMVWQDCMFACAMYPGSKDFLANVKEEMDAQIPRITSHPSVVLINGNNEVDIAWKHWGYQLKYGLFGKSAREIKKAYDDLFLALIPERVEHWSTVPYIHTSPLSHWGKDDYYRHGSQHYWGVWHGKDPIEDFGNKSGRFNAEYGFQSFPEYATLNQVIEQKDWDLNSEIMKLRQKSYVGNNMILKHAEKLYGKPANFDRFIYYSQLTQARALNLGISAHRIDWPRCSGTIYWQINDCWPAPTWSTIDYFGNWKAAHYQVQKDFKNINILALEKELNHKQFFLVTDWLEKNYKTTIFIELYDLYGNKIHQYEKEIELQEQQVVALPIFEHVKDSLSNYILQISWIDEYNKKSQRVFYNHTSPLPKTMPKIEVEIMQVNDGNQKLIISTDSVLFDCWIHMKKHALHLDRNFETLLPGQHEFIILSPNDSYTSSDIELHFLPQ